MLRAQVKYITPKEEKALEKELDVPPPEFETLDAKISSALDAATSGSVAVDIAVLTDR